MVFPELSLTGYTCEDLFLTDDLAERTERALLDLALATTSLSTIIVAANAQLLRRVHLRPAVELRKKSPLAAAA